MQSLDARPTLCPQAARQPTKDTRGGCKVQGLGCVTCQAGRLTASAHGAGGDDQLINDEGVVRAQGRAGQELMRQSIDDVSIFQRGLEASSRRRTCTPHRICRGSAPRPVQSTSPPRQKQPWQRWARGAIEKPLEHRTSTISPRQPSSPCLMRQGHARATDRQPTES